MSLESTVRKVVMDAVKEYNNTVAIKNRSHLTDTYDNKRGIFYNSLRRGFQTHMRSVRPGEVLNVSALSCVFRPNATIEKFHITEPLYGHAIDNETYEVRSLVARFGREGFLDTVIDVDIESIKHFNFHQ